MGLRPKRPCSAPSCPNLLDAGEASQLCASCRGTYDEQRGSSSVRGYDGRFGRLRIICLVRDRWRCQKCDWEPDIVRLSREYELPDLPPAEKVLEELRNRAVDGERHLQVDHVIPISQAPELRLELGNLQVLCDACHRTKTLAENRGVVWE